MKGYPTLHLSSISSEVVGGVVKDRLVLLLKGFPQYTWTSRSSTRQRHIIPRHLQPFPEMALLSLPIELIDEISEHLASDHCSGSLAALNVTCKWLRGATLPILFRTVVLVRRAPNGLTESPVRLYRNKGVLPEGCRYTQ